MPSALALTSKFALGRQSAKGTPVTANLICGRYVQTSLQSIYEYIEAQNEHYCGPSARPTARKSFSRASGYTVPFGAQGFLYADSLPIMLIGAGFGCVSNTGGINEVTTLTTTGIPTGGTFTITYGAQTTAAIPYNATATQVAVALRALSTIGENDIMVTESTGAGGKIWSIEWLGSTVAGTNITPPTATASLTGGSTPGITVATPTGGVVGTNAKRHNLTIADRANAAWVTALHSYADGGDLFTLRAVDARIEQIAIEASTRGTMLTMAGVGLTENAATGSETFINEGDKMLLPSKGACTININGATLTAPIRGLRMMISNPLNKNEQTMFQLARADLPANGIEAGFSAAGIDVDYALYRSLKWGGTAGVGPVVGSVQGDVTFNFQSAELIGTAAGDLLPYSTTVTINNVEMRMGNFQARGRELVRFDLAGIMVDTDVNAAPIVVQVQNGIASY